MLFRTMSCCPVVEVALAQAVVLFQVVEVVDSLVAAVVHHLAVVADHPVVEAVDPQAVEDANTFEA